MGGAATSIDGARYATCLRGEPLTGLCAPPAAVRLVVFLAFELEVDLPGALGFLVASRAEDRVGDAAGGGAAPPLPFPRRGEGPARGGLFSESLRRDEDAWGSVRAGGGGSTWAFWLLAWSWSGRCLFAGWSPSFITIGFFLDPAGSTTTTFWVE